MSEVSTLRAMAANYANGHLWDHLDGEACIRAVDEILRLQKLVEEMTEALVFYSHEPAYSSTWETLSCGCCYNEIEPEVLNDRGQIARDILSKALTHKEKVK